MAKSGARILTTHAGSLPRPPELTRLYTRRSHGEAVDESVLAAAGREAVAWVVGKQRQAGIDIISNGEQQRESFVLYLRHRLSGIGGQGSRGPRRRSISINTPSISPKTRRRGRSIRWWRAVGRC